MLFQLYVLLANSKVNWKIFPNEDFLDRFLAYNNNFISGTDFNKVAEAMKGIVSLTLFIFYYIFDLNNILICIVLEDHFACCRRDPVPLLQRLRNEIDAINKQWLDEFYIKCALRRYLTKYHDDVGA